jgi:hypothetical protein
MKNKQALFSQPVYLLLFFFLDLDDNLHGNQLLQQPQESINRVTGKI